MQDWQKRVVEEKKLLDENMQRLGYYIQENILHNTTLEDYSFLLLCRQYHIMQAYSKTLQERINNFKED